MIAKQWRARLTYLIMSLFVTWHTIAIILAPFQHLQQSATAPSFQFLVQAYHTLLRLENTWSFFAPVSRSHQFRYVIEDVAGDKHAFAPVTEFKWFHPRYSWFERAYWGIMTKPELYSDYFADFFCRKHVALNPVSITLQEIQEEDFQPEDHLNGRHPLDPDYVTENNLKQVACSQQSRLPAPTKGRVRPQRPRS